MSRERNRQIRVKLQELYVLINEETLVRSNALKNSLQGRFSKQIAQKDEIVNKAADSLIEVVNKLKNALHSR